MPFTLWTAPEVNVSSILVQLHVLFVSLVQKLAQAQMFSDHDVIFHLIQYEKFSMNAIKTSIV